MSFSWNANTHWKKKIFDLHNIFGFYVCLFALILAFTGLVWGFQWFANGLHKMAGGKKSLEYADPGSAKTSEQMAIASPIDSVWVMMQREYPQAKSIEVHPPENEKS